MLHWFSGAMAASGHGLGTEAWLEGRSWIFHPRETNLAMKFNKPFLMFFLFIELM
jgi:hypothetical protein